MSAKGRLARLADRLRHSGPPAFVVFFEDGLEGEAPEARAEREADNEKARQRLAELQAAGREVFVVRVVWETDLEDGAADDLAAVDPRGGGKAP